ncbi:MAG: PorP/SprF family type IX secretion system membrane protein [Bacteroidales bacterium]|nr:PorP/SprF family type IX secretion system membrane protein [Bacteroidales bacterium]
MISITKAMFRLAIILIMTCIAGMTAAQEYNFAQYYLDKLGISPAFVSVGDYNEVGFAMRSQWPGVDGGFKIYMAEYQQKLPTYSSGIGMRVYGDIGDKSAFSTTCADLLYGYDFGITDNLKCSFGLSAGFVGRSIRQENMVYYSMIDPLDGSVGSLNEKLTSVVEYRGMTFGVGTAIYTKETMVAIGLHRLANLVLTGASNYSPSVLSVMANHKFKIGGTEHKLEQFIVPTLCYSHSRYADMIMPGVYYSGYRLLLSMAFRMEKADKMATSVVLGAGFDFGKVELSIGHEMETSAVLRQTCGSYEVGCKYKFEKTEKNRSGKTILCPAF